MSIYKRGNVFWCQFYVNGKLHRQSTEQVDRKDAERHERAIRAKAEANAPKVRKGVGTLKDLSDADIQRVKTGKRDAGHIRRIQDIWKELHYAFGENSDPIAITSSAVFKYVEERQSLNLKNQSIRRELQALMRALKMAAEKKWIDGIPSPWPKLSNDQPNESRKGRRLTKDTLQKVLMALPDNARDGVMFCLTTGLRLHELWRVRASMISAAPANSKAKAVLNMPKWSTKGRKPRPIGLNADAVKIVKRRAKLLGDEIFPKYDYTQAMKRAAAKLEMSGQGIHMRSLRHTYASEALQRSGGNLSAVGRALGHSELEITTLYLHANDADVINLADSVITVYDHSRTKKKGRRHAST